jgi:electron transfer flavoprotein beta subunit
MMAIFPRKPMDLKILVPIKRVVDYSIKVRVKSDGTGIETANVKMSMNPFDEIAVEEAVRIKEQSNASELIAVSIGTQGCQEVLRTALAMGMDRAIHVQTDQTWEAINIAKILQKIVTQEAPNLVIMGKQAIDDDCNQTGQMLAALLDWPQATFVSKMVVQDQRIQVTREVDGGLETLEVMLPAVVTTDLRLNKPRYSSLPNIMKAKQKKLDSILLEDLSLDLQQHLKILKITGPALKKGGVIVSSVKELVQKLHDEAKII